MRVLIDLFVLAFCLFAAMSAAAGPIRVGVEPISEIEGPVLVRVNGHYLSIHGGNSHHWKDAFIPVGGRHFVPLGPVNLLINVGVSVRIIHPEIVSESSVSTSTPLLIRPVGFETFQPRTWRDIMARGESRFGERPDTPAGHVLPLAYWHLRSILNEYLPALDMDTAIDVSDGEIRHQLALLERIVRYALDAPPPSLDKPARMPSENLASYQRSIRDTRSKTRVEIEEMLHQLREWLSLDHGERRHIREMMKQMRYPQRVAAHLMTDIDRRQLGDFIGRAAAGRANRKTLQKGSSWTNPNTQVSYRARMLRSSGECARLNLQVDLTRVVVADLDEMVRSVEGRFCRDADGKSRYGRS
jgi:hypothetical protein